MSTKLAIWPSFIAAPFMDPSSSSIFSAVSVWKRASASSSRSPRSLAPTRPAPVEADSRARLAPRCARVPRTRSAGSPRRGVRRVSGTSGEGAMAPIVPVRRRRQRRPRWWYVPMVRGLGCGPAWRAPPPAATSMRQAMGPALRGTALAGRTMEAAERGRCSAVGKGSRRLRRCGPGDPGRRRRDRAKPRQGAQALTYVDPNEDVVAAAIGDEAMLLVVADGHNGVQAAEIAVDVALQSAGVPTPELAGRLVGLFGVAHEAVRAATASLRLPHRESRTTLTIGLLCGGTLSWVPTPELAGRLVGLFGVAHEAVRAATASLRLPHRERRTTLTVGLLCGGTLWWASLGDSTLMLVTPRDGLAVTTGRHRFVGFAMPTRDLLADVDHGSVAVPDDAWVVAATDGFLNFTLNSDPARAAAVVLARQRKAADGARALIAHAFSAGAGDNVAVGVVEPARSRKAKLG